MMNDRSAHLLKSWTKLYFWPDRRANVAIMAAMIATPVIGLVGGSVDYMVASNAELQLHQVLDGAAFAAAKPVEIGLDERQVIAQTYMMENLPPSLQDQQWSVDVRASGNSITASAELSVDTSFLGIFGMDTLAVGATSQVDRLSSRPLEIVLAMDTTNSMKSISGGWDQAIDHINELLGAILNEADANTKKLVTVLPFTDRIAIGTGRADWLDGAAPVGWSGCVEPREKTIGSVNYALDTSLPSVEPFQATIPGVSGGLASRGGGYPFCGPTMTGPSNNLSELSSALNDLDAQGSGRFDDALAWSWRLLSPEWQNLWGVSDYPAPKGQTEKVIAFFTDGHTNAFHFETIPFPQPGNTDNHVPPAAGALIEDLCRRIIADDIKIFIFYLNGSDVSRPYFERCTNDSDRFFEIGGVTELKDALEVLVGGGELRLVN